MNSKSVSNLYKNSAVAKLVMDYITLNGKGQDEFFAHTLVEALKLKHLDVVEVFKSLELTGYGVWFRGRSQPHRTRFEAVHTVEELEHAMHDSKYVAGKPHRVVTKIWMDKGHAPLIATPPVRASNGLAVVRAVPAAVPVPVAAPTCYNVLSIRPDFVLKIPADLSDTDKKKLVDFVNMVK